MKQEWGIFRVLWFVVNEYEFVLRYDAVGCCEYPLIADEGPSTDVTIKTEVQADLPGP